MDTSVVILITKPSNYLIPLHQEERVYVLLLDSELRDCTVTKYYRSYALLVCRPRPEKLAASFLSFEMLALGTQPPSCAEAQATCRC